MRYAGSAWPERSQIRPAFGKMDRDHIRHFYSGPDGHRPIRIGSAFLHPMSMHYPVSVLPERSQIIGTTSGISISGRRKGQLHAQTFVHADIQEKIIV